MGSASVRRGPDVVLSAESRVLCSKQRIRGLMVRMIHWRVIRRYPEDTQSNIPKTNRGPPGDKKDAS